MRNLFFLFSFLTVSLLQAQTKQFSVVEYHPAPGQFVNLLPEAEEGTTHAEICRRCEELLEDESVVHLGTFGGYITVQFHQPVPNLLGSDLRILGNSSYAMNDPAFGKETIGGSFEPGIVYVGVGDDVETAQWYELAGSEYYKSEIHDFQVTYHRPTSESGKHEQSFSSYDEYIRWEATWMENGVRRDSTGYHIKNTFHKQSYWPLWEEGEAITLRGGRLPNNGVDYSGKGTNWVLYRYAADAYGYVDASLNTDPYSTFDIDWAVDRHGRPVQLSEINFVRVVNAMFQYCGWIGETSTEVGNFINLHQQPGYDQNPIIIQPDQETALHGTTLRKADTGMYDLTGRRITTPRRGIYIRNGKLVTY